eukprot:2112370-Lingulodinium_polyedra.AAC.1
MGHHGPHPQGAAGGLAWLRPSPQRRGAHVHGGGLRGRLRPRAPRAARAPGRRIDLATPGARLRHRAARGPEDAVRPVLARGAAPQAHHDG